MKDKKICDGELIECGHVGRAVGLKGYVAVFWNSGNSPFLAGDEIFAGPDLKKISPYKLSALKKQGRSHAARFEGFADRARAQTLRGLKIFIPAKNLAALPKGEYYSFEILGLDVFTEEGKNLGRIEKIFTAGGHDVYEVRDGDKEILIPAVDHVVLKIDLKAKKVIVRLLEGMCDSIS